MTKVGFRSWQHSVKLMSKFFSPAFIWGKQFVPLFLVPDRAGFSIFFDVSNLKFNKFFDILLYVSLHFFSLVF